VEEAITIRTLVPKILTRRAQQGGFELLLRFIDTSDRGLRLAVLTAASKLREKYSELPIDEHKVMSVLKEELHTFYELHLMRAGLALTPRDVLLDDALQVRVTRTQQRMFKLLGLTYSPKEMELVWLNLTSTMPQARANAVEILDNILEGEAKRLVVPMAEGTLDRLKIAVDEFGLARHSRVEWLAVLLDRDDPWVQVATMEVVAREGSKPLSSKLAQFKDSPDPLVRETAQWASQ